MSFLDISAIPVPTANRSAYATYIGALAPLFTSRGAMAIHDAWAVDLPEGVQTDFRKAVALRGDETLAMSWILWPDQATRDSAWAELMEDPAFSGAAMPFDGSRMIFGAFETLIPG